MTSSRPLGYAVALLAAAAGVLLKVGLGSVGPSGTYVLPFAAVFFSAWYGGLGPGCLTAVASAALSYWLLAGTGPTGTGMFAVLTMGFLVAGASTSWAVAHKQRLRRELEAGVAARTAELVAANQRLEAEMARRQHAEERFRSAFEHAPIGMGLAGIDGQPSRVNAALCRMLGYTEEELISMPVWAVTHPDDMPATIEQLQRLVEGEIDHWELEKRFFHKNGDLVWASSSTSLVRDGNGRALYVVSQLQDITARKQAEVALREERNFAAAVVDTVGALVGVVDREGRIVRFNRACERTLGYSAAEVIGRYFWDLLPIPGEVGQARVVFERLLEGKWPTEYETYWFKRDGTPCLLTWSTTFLRDASGAVQYVIGSGIDITKRKQAEAALRASEEYFQHAFKSAPIGMTLVGLDAVPLQVNSALSEMFGYSEEELLRKPVPEVTHPDDMEAAYRDRARLLAGEIGSYQAERRYVHKLGHIVWAQLNVSLVRAPDGAPLYLVTQLQDITARKHAEELVRQAQDELETRVVQRTAELTATNFQLRDEIERRQAVEHELEALNRRILDILESMAGGFFAVDKQLRFTYVNRSAEQMVQRPRETLLGKNAWEVFPEAMRSRFYKQYEQVMAEQGPVQLESYYPPLNRWFTVRMYPTRDGISALFEDSTERHTSEMTVMSDILRALNAEVDVSEAYPKVAARIQMLTECARSALGLFDAQRKFVKLIALDEMEGPFLTGSRLPIEYFPGAEEVLAGQPHVVPNLAAECGSPVIHQVFTDGFRSGVGVPLRGTEGVIGMLVLLWRHIGGPNVAHLPLLDQIAAAVALAVEKSNLFDEVRAGRARLQALSRRLMEVQESERRHIARELHDEVGQHLTGLKLLLEGLERPPAHAVPARVVEAHQLVDDLLRRVRELSLDLRPAMLDDLGLLPALLWLFDRYTTQTAVRVRFEHSGLESRFPQEVETAAYRIVQEALTNVARYAGVGEVAVTASATRGVLTLHVVDRGHGFDREHVLADGHTSGLAGMRERVLLVGGQLTVESAPDAGTRLVAALPFRESVPPSTRDRSRALG